MSEALAPVLIGSGGAVLALAGLLMLRTSAASARAEGGADGTAATPEDLWSEHRAGR